MPHISYPFFARRNYLFIVSLIFSTLPFSLSPRSISINFPSNDSENWYRRYTDVTYCICFRIKRTAKSNEVIPSSIAFTLFKHVILWDAKNFYFIFLFRFFVNFSPRILRYNRKKVNPIDKEIECEFYLLYKHHRQSGRLNERIEVIRKTDSTSYGTNTNNGNGVVEKAFVRCIRSAIFMYNYSHSACWLQIEALRFSPQHIHNKPPQQIDLFERDNFFHFGWYVNNSGHLMYSQCAEPATTAHKCVCK